MSRAAAVPGTGLAGGIGAAALIAVAAGCALWWPTALIDDAYISFRYAVNWVDGHGPVFNPGERVEGYTNFLWVLLLTPFEAAGLPLELVARWLGAGCAVAATAVLAFARLDGAAPRWASPVAALLLGLNPAFSLWAVHGLETALFGLCIVAAMVVELRSPDRAPPLAGLLWAAASWTRPEAVLLFAAAAATRLLPGGLRLPDRRSWTYLVAFGVPVGFHVTGRLLYYGELLPNTFHAKVGLSAAVLSRGAGYLGGGFALPGGLLFLAALYGTVAALRQAALRPLAVVTATGLAVIVIEGGRCLPGLALRGAVAAVTVLTRPDRWSAGGHVELGTAAASMGLGRPRADAVRAPLEHVERGQPPRSRRCGCLYRQAAQRGGWPGRSLPRRYDGRAEPGRSDPLAHRIPHHRHARAERSAHRPGGSRGDGHRPGRTRKRGPAATCWIGGRT